MFLKSLKIENSLQTIREISFFKGINLIIDETKTDDRRESGNSVGKTTVLRLIDFCFGGEGKNIYQDTEFRKTSNTSVEEFLKSNNIVITLTLKDDLENENSREIEIKRNFLSRSKKIQLINNESYKDKEFLQKLKELIFNSTADKPTFRQIIAKNVRDEKNRLINTIKVLHQSTTLEEYEALYLFWLGIDVANADRKHQLSAERKMEENLQKRLKSDSTLSQVTQSLIVINRTIQNLQGRKSKYNVNENYNTELSELMQVKSEINRLSTEFSRLELRKELILESKVDLENDLAKIDTRSIQKLYEEAKTLIPDLQKTFEDTLNFHNQMIVEKVKYITQELPNLDNEIISTKSKISTLLGREKILTDSLNKTLSSEDLQSIITELNKAYEKKGNLEEQKRLWESSNSKLEKIEKELEEINTGITSKETLIQSRIAEFNKYFADISSRLYGEQFVLSPDKNEKGYELNITTISGNLGTGKKKGQMAAFDLAYIQFADALGIKCLHFILQDQIENVHDNQISNLLTEIVSQINCQYILPVLRDKLPEDINVEQYQILSLSETDKLFKI